MTISQEDMIVLEEAQIANAWYFKALVYAARVIPQRRKMYSGNENPFKNFEIAARIRGSSTDECFQWYIALKAARAEMGQGDFGLDNSFADTLRDWGNYVLLWLGHKIYTKEQEKAETENG